MGDLVLPSRVLRQLGPAVNSGKALLLYGPSGNGKTSVAERLGLVFRQTAYIPHALKVDQQIIKVYDEAGPSSRRGGEPASGRTRADS